MRDFDERALELRLRKVLHDRLDDLPFTLTPESVASGRPRLRSLHTRRRTFVALCAAAALPALLALGTFLGGAAQPSRPPEANASETPIASPSSIPATPTAPAMNAGPANGLIAYSLNGQLFVTAPDGSNSRPITPADWRAFDPRWSPDGERIAFLSLTCLAGEPCDQKASPTSINVINADGSGRRTLAKDLYEVRPFKWSPDGRWLAYSAYQPRGLHLVAADGSEQRTMAPGQFIGWSPDGSKLAYEGDDGVHVIAPDGTGDRLLFQAPFEHLAAGAQWSPDGSQIAFSVQRGGFVNRTYESWIADGSGGSARRMTELPAGTSFVGWRPDGRKIAYLSPRPAGSSARFDLVLANPDGSEPVAVADQAPNGWSPDGTRMYLFEGDFPATRLVLIDVTGGTARVEIPAEFDISWQAIR